MQAPWRHSYDPWFPHHLRYPEHSMYEAMKETAEAHPDRPIMAFFKATYTYADLMAEIDHAAKALIEDGFQSGDVMTICLPNIPQAVILFYAINGLGGICNMLHPLSPAAEIVKTMKQTKSHTLFILDAQRKKLGDGLLDPQLTRIVPCSVASYMDPMMAVLFKLKFSRKIGKTPQGEPFLDYPAFIAAGQNRGLPSVHKRPARSPAVYLHSGGTTGEPKTIVLSDYNFNALAIQGPGILGDGTPFEAKDQTHIAILPLFHGFGLGIGMHLMLVLGIKIVLVPKFTPGDMASVIKKHKPTVLAGVPTLFEGIIRAKALKHADLSHLKNVFVGGDPLTPELRKRFEQFTKERNAELTLREGYGLTETVTVNTVSPYLDNRLGTVGLPISDIYVKICELGTETECAYGEDGEICVSGPTMMLGYLDDKAATENTLRVHADGLTWVHTGDLGRMDEDGFITFLQRLKRIIKVSGVPVFPSQIEKVVETIPGIKHVAAVALPHPYKQEVVALYVVKDHDASEAALNEAIPDRIGQEMLAYAKPAVIKYIEEMPLTLVGKIDIVSLEARIKTKAPAFD